MAIGYKGNLGNLASVCYCYFETKGDVKHMDHAWRDIFKDSRWQKKNIQDFVPRAH
jgi:hypothetical protein